MNVRIESRLLLTARILVLILPACLLGGRVAVDAAMSLTMILFLARSFMARDWRWARNTWFKVGVGLWLWMLFITLFAMDPKLSFSQSAPWIRFLIFAAALEAWVLDEVWMRRLLWVATGTVIFAAGDALLQYVTGSDLLGNPRWSADRLAGVFDRPKVGIFITKLMFPVVVGVFAWHAWRRGRLWPSTAFAGLVLLLISTIYLSGERMALLLALLGLVVAGLLQKGILRSLVLGSLSLGAVSMVVLAVFNPSTMHRQVTETLDTITHLGESHYGRIWNSGLHLVTEHPLLGVGMKNFRIACPADNLPLNPEERCGTHPHNLYMEWLVESGIPGLIGFALLVAAWFRRIGQVWLRYGYNPWVLGPAISLFIQVWPLGPSGSFFSNWTGGLFWLAVGWSLAAARLLEQHALEKLPVSDARGVAGRVAAAP